MAFIDKLLAEKRAEIHKEALRLANTYFLRCGHIPERIKYIARETAPGNTACKFNPNHDELGRFTFGVGSGENNNNINDPPIQPVYPIETILGGLAVGEALASARVLAGLGEGAIDTAEGAIEDAIQSIENYLGGTPDKVFPNDAGDMIIMKDDKKIRFDINNPGNDDPHFHIQQENSDGDWTDAGSQHRYYFLDGE